MNLSERIKEKKSKNKPQLRVSGKICECGRANSSFAKACICGKKL